MGLLSGRSSPDCTSTRAAAAGPRWRYRPTAPVQRGSLVPSKGCALCSWDTTTTTRGAASTRCALAYLQLVCGILIGWPQDMQLCYGQHTGYGGYDAGSGRGARVVRVTNGTVETFV